MFAALVGAVAALFGLKRYEKKLEAELALAELDRDRARVVTQIASFLVKMQRDPISALNLRFIEGDGLASDPFEFKGKILVGGIQVLRSPGDPGEWAPPEYQEGSTTIRPLVGSMAEWGIAVAFRVAHQNPDFRLKLDWFKKSDPASGPVYLVTCPQEWYHILC